MNDKIQSLIVEFRNLTEVYQKLNDLIPPEVPEKASIIVKILEAQFWLRFLIDIETAEIENPVKIGLKEKPHANTDS